MKKKLMALVLCTAMALGLMACGGSSDSGDAKKEDGAKADYKIAMVTDSGDITDQSFNQTTYESCKAFAEANNVEFKYYKPEGDTQEARDASFDQAVAEGFNIVVLPGYLFGPTIANKASMYPDVKIVGLDVTSGDIGLDKIPDNVYTAVYHEELSGYMAGYAAVKMGFKHLGFVGGMEVPAVQRFGYGYVQGIDAAAKELNIEKDVKVEYAYGNQFYGDADITAYMDTWYGSKGVEIVFACGGGIYTSAAEAAAKVDGKVIGVDSDQSAIIDKHGAGMTITSAMKGLDVTVKDVLTGIILDNKWDSYKGQCANLGLVSENPDDNFVKLPMDTTQWTDSFTADDYKELVAAMYKGDVTVSDDIEKQPTTTVEVDYQGNIK